MRFSASLLSFVLVVLFATPSIAQKVNATPLKWNPYRDQGGSCVYGANNELLHAPKGSDCKERRDVPTSKAPEPEPNTSNLVSLPTDLRGEAESLLNEHTHIAKELAELRRSIATEEKKYVLGAADRVIEELARHYAREEKLLRSIAPRQK